MPDPDVSRVQLYGTEIELIRGGAGRPLLIFHGAWGNPGWLTYLNHLATDFEIYLPTHPGFGNSQRHPGLETIHDLVDFYLDFLDHFWLDRPALMGFSLGGWLAAELAATCPERFDKLVLVGAAGLRVEEAPIADIFLATKAELMALSFHDAKSVGELERICPPAPSEAQSLAKERSQIMAQVLAWKPYMHNPKLPYRLHRIRMPTLVVWGRQDGIVPPAHGEAYANAIPDARLKLIDRCGHAPHLERPGEFTSLVREFLAPIRG
jgi:pimeloyl-ACP methyl ester carboxylesterase